MFSLHVCGGIGSQFLRYLAGVGYCIEANIPLDLIRVTHHLYDIPSSGEWNPIYHNHCTLDHFLDFTQGNFSLSAYNSDAKQFNFDKNMLNYCLLALVF